MAEFWRSKKFRELYKTWNSKLKSSGFVDSETDLQGDRALKQRATNSYRQADQLERESRLDYYMLLGNLVHNTNFNSEVDEIVMTLHADGFSIKEIMAEMGKKGFRRHRHTIRFIIKRWQMKWGIKHWSPKQMNLKKATG